LANRLKNIAKGKRSILFDRSVSDDEEGKKVNIDTCQARQKRLFVKI
jgi:hypothetical protein